jgi:hypothetical protein
MLLKEAGVVGLHVVDRGVAEKARLRIRRRWNGIVAACEGDLPLRSVGRKLHRLQHRRLPRCRLAGDVHAVLRHLLGIAVEGEPPRVVLDLRRSAQAEKLVAGEVERRNEIRADLREPDVAAGHAPRIPNGLGVDHARDRRGIDIAGIGHGVERGEDVGAAAVGNAGASREMVHCSPLGCLRPINNHKEQAQIRQGGVVPGRRCDLSGFAEGWSSRMSRVGFQPQPLVRRGGHGMRGLECRQAHFSCGED